MALGRVGQAAVGDFTISVRELSKAYTIRHNATDHITLAELTLDRVRHPLRRAAREEFWALRDVSFDVSQGEILGLIGRNGAGKSTLLKVLARITDPTCGEVHLRGRVGSLLEVGTGFHPELTGRENIYLNGSILGMESKEIASKFDAIVDFAGVEQFLDTPVKRFSSGMYVRLAFAVAAHLDSEILLLDEVLAVGDADFQAKCLGKVRDLAGGGRTVILVSHNMGTVASFADRTALLVAGGLAAIGTTDAVIGDYLEQRQEVAEGTDVDGLPRVYARFGRRARIVRVRLNHPNAIVGAGSDLSFAVTVRGMEDIDALRLGQSVCRADGSCIGTSFTSSTISLSEGEETTLEVTVPQPRLAPGRYTLALSIGFGGLTQNIDDLDFVAEGARFEVAPDITDSGVVTRWEREWGAVRFLEPAIMTIEATSNR